MKHCLDKKNIRDVISLLPLLLLYVILVLLFSTETFWGDEGRYVMFATNLSHGYYSPRDEMNLWNGPGYPMVLLPFILLKLPLLTVKLFNALFLFMALIYFYHTLLFYMQKRAAMFFSYILGLYPPLLRYMPFILTEQLTILLVCGFMFHFCRLHRDNKKNWPQILIASVYLGYLALTKIIFGYVILSGIMLFLFLFLWKKKDVFKKTSLVFAIALLICMPYLLYTYSLTGKIFYWGNSGGLALYLMSTPYEEELGDWYIKESKYHEQFFKELANLSSIQKDDELKKRAFQNIVKHPTKYFKNWAANIGRLLFQYPFSYVPQTLSTYFYIIPNMFLIVCFVLSLYPAYIGYKFIPFEITGLILFGLIAFWGSTLGNAENRYFWPLVPVFALWIFFVFSNFVKIDIRQ